MIISASRRTDIPAFYAEWFMGRMRAGYCLTVNPFNPAQVTRVSLRPEEVEVICFWTRDARPMLPHLAELDARGYRYLFYNTLTAYDRALEPHSPTPAEARDTLRRLAEHLGPQRVCWRYDPIVFTNTMPPACHAEQFARLATMLEGLTQRVTISIMTPYRCAVTRLRRLAARDIVLQDVPPETPAFADLMRALSGSAAAHGMEICSCATELDLRPYGIQPGRCIDGDYLRRVFGIEVSRKRDTNQRPACGCAISKDIGAYDTCVHECVYCYATHNPATARARHAAHHPDAPALLPVVEAAQHFVGNSAPTLFPNLRY